MMLSTLCGVCFACGFSAPVIDSNVMVKYEGEASVVVAIGSHWLPLFASFLIFVVSAIRCPLP